MPSHNSKKTWLNLFGRKKGRSRAAALVVTLSVVLLLSLLVVSLTVAMRMDRQASHYFIERARAEFLAREGVESVRAVMTGAIGVTNRSWVSMPGRILVWTNGTTVPVTNILYSLAETNSGSDPSLAARDLNRLVLSDDGHTLITGETNTNRAMRVGWIYVRKNGVRETNQSPNLQDANNPIIGRFAYWTDDESSRLDLNTAWQRQTNESPGHPSQVDLTALSDALSTNAAGLIHAAATSRGFDTPDEARRLEGMRDLLSTNRLLTTHYTHSALLNPFGEPKIFLTTQKSNLPPDIAARPDSSNFFLDILATNNTDPGLIPNIVPSKYTYQLGKLVSLMSRTNWNSISGSYYSKYNFTNAMQIAADIIGYVRSVESPQLFLETINILPTTNTNQIRTRLVGDKPNPQHDHGYVVESIRRPLFTEFAAQASSLRGPNTNIKGTTTNITYDMDVMARMEIYCPKQAGITPADLTNARINFTTSYLCPTTEYYGQADPDGVYNNVILENSTVPPTRVTIDGEFAIVEYPKFTTRMAATNNPLGERPTEFYFVMSVLDRNFKPADNRQFEKVPQPRYNATNGWGAVVASGEIYGHIKYVVDPDPDRPLADVDSVSVNDPRVNKFATNWLANRRPTWGRLNDPELKAGAVPVPDQDAGSLSTNLFYMPPRKGSVNPLTGETNTGLVKSVAEIGYISTGIAGTTDVPWRSLSMKPASPNQSPPDWLLLDCFVAPISPTNNPTLYFPGGGIAGRINLNAANPYPFTNLAGANFRLAPLKALFRGVTNSSGKLSESEIEELAERVARRDSFIHTYGSTNYYESIGKLLEVSGVVNEDESSESIARQIVDHVSLQGNVFRVYSVGQSLKQTPDGKLILQAESSVCAMVERDIDGKLRTVFWKVLPL